MIAPPDPPLSDGVVTLRPWSERDVPAVAPLLDGDPEITRWMETIPQPYRESDARAWIERTLGYWREGSGAQFAITDAQNDALLGGIGIGWTDATHGVAEVGYWLTSKARGRGLTTRALRLITQWTLGPLQCQRLQLRADERNIASQRVAEKAGFTREGVLRSVQFSARHNRRIDFVIFSQLPTDAS